MSFLHPRTITIKRPGAQTGVGAVGYGGQLPSTETPLFTGLEASIQAARTPGSSGVGLPGDSRGSGWQIFFKGPAVGAVRNRDIIIDDQGNRYQVSTAYWNPLGVWKCEAQLLEA